MIIEHQLEEIQQQTRTEQMAKPNKWTYFPARVLRVCTFEFQCVHVAQIHVLVVV